MKELNVQLSLKNPDSNTSIYAKISEKESNNVVIACHGFDSSKEGSTINALMEKLNCTVISFDFPAHGESNDKLLLKNCINYLKEVTDYVIDNYKGKKINYFGTSFGCYVIINFLKQYKVDYNKVFFKSAAIKMDEILINKLIEDDINTFRQNGYTIKHRNKEMKIPYDFYQELVDNKISNIKLDDSFYFFHGNNDDTASSKDLSSNCNVILLENANHRFNDQELTYMCNMINEILEKEKYH